MHNDNWPIDSWSTGPSEEQVMDPTVLTMIDHYITEHFPTLLSLVVVHHGVLVVERYYHDWQPEDRVNAKSVTKSIVSALVGIALRQRLVTSLDQRLYEFCPEFFPAHGDPRKRAITLQHLLTLRSGLCWVEQEHVQALFASHNWVQYGLSLPLQHTPGEVFAYSTLDAHLLSAALSRASGGDLLAFANTYLFGPLGSTLTQWARDPQGHPIGGSELYMTPSQMAKFGSLYLRRGVWGGEQIIPEEYVEASIHTQVSTGVSAVADPNVTLSETYGYLWWVSTVGPYMSFFALGYGGQTIYVIPALDVVLVTAAQWTVPVEQGAGLYAFTMAHALAEQFVLPALAP